MKRFLQVLLLSLTFFGCTKDHPGPAVTIDATALELKFDKEHQFTLKEGSDNVSASNFTWTSSDEKVGKVDANGLFKARKIGKTTITAMPKAGGPAVTSEITVSPYQTFITEPKIDFTATTEIIKSWEKRSLLSESETSLAYDDSDPKIKYVTYLFENGLETSALVIFEYPIDDNLVRQFYAERYPDRGTKENIDFDPGKRIYEVFLDDERKFAVVVFQDSPVGPNAYYMRFKPN